MSGFLPYIHNLRGLAILFVICVHALGYDSDWSSHPGINRFFESFFDPSEGNGTTLFLFIGGFLFQHLTHKNFEFRKYIEQKFKVIILPYIIISIPLILFRLKTGFESLSLPEDFHTHSSFYQILYYLITGAHMAPFWFIPTIVLIYLSAPLLHRLDHPIFYQFVFPFLLLICLFTYRPLHNANPFLAYVHFMPVYAAGMWASFHKEKILAGDTKLLYVLVAVYLLITIADLSGWIGLSRTLSFEKIMEDQQMIFNIYMFKALVLCFMLMMVLYLLRYKEMPLIELLGHYSFGIFFVHYIFISISRRVFSVFDMSFDFTVLTYFIFILFILLLSTVTVYLLKKLTGQYSRYFIGS